MARYPGLVRTLVAHEPPVSELLPDAERWRANNTRVGEIYQQAGVGPALSFFVELVFASEPGGEPRPAEPTTDTAEPTANEAESEARVLRNLELFAGWLIPHIGNYEPDLAGLRATSTRIVVGVGKRSRPEQMPHQTSHALAEQLGVELAEFPGDHFVEASAPAEFAARLRGLLGAGG